MRANKNKILFIGKEKDNHCLKALEFCQNNFENVTAHLGKWGDNRPEEIDLWHGDYIISYLSRWIIPESLINNTKIAAINFHPATPDYPGYGCGSFALYDNVVEFGVTCHHMSVAVDTGNIIAVKKFPVYSNDNVDTLLSRTYDFQLVLFFEMLGLILNGELLPKSNEMWSRKPFTRKEFNKLTTITPDMPKEEIEKRIRATSYGIWQPTLELNGFTFELKL